MPHAHWNKHAADLNWFEEENYWRVEFACTKFDQSLATEAFKWAGTHTLSISQAHADEEWNKGSGGKGPLIVGDSDNMSIIRDDDSQVSIKIY